MIDVKDLLQRAMQLPPEARAALAGSLLESLDDVVDPDAEAAWAAEIERRVEQIDSGAVKLEPWSEVRNKISG
jgi:putative addiction module component (TIGR02574 family)